MFTHLTDDQWQRIEPLLPSLPVRADGKGRRWRDSRPVLDGILWVLPTGAPWAALPTGAPWAALPRGEYPPYQTCHRRFRRWVKDDTLKRIAHAFAQRAGLDLSECFIDGTFASAKKGAMPSARPSGARAPS